MACWGGSLERVPPRPFPNYLIRWKMSRSLDGRGQIAKQVVQLGATLPERCRGDVNRVRSGHAIADVYGDRRLLRVLRMDPDRDEDLAVKKVGEYLAWRRDTNADDLRAKVPSDGPDPSKWPHGEVMYQCLRLIQC